MNEQLLDPLCTMIKLIQLNFKTNNTKLSINNHILELHDPSISQWLVRKYRGDSRDNIAEIYNAIVRLIKWFILDNKDDDKLNDHNLNNIKIDDGKINDNKLNDDKINNEKTNSINCDNSFGIDSDDNINNSVDDNKDKTSNTNTNTNLNDNKFNENNDNDSNINELFESDDDESVSRKTKSEECNSNPKNDVKITQSTSLKCFDMNKKISLKIFENKKKSHMIKNNQEFKIIGKNEKFYKLVLYLISGLEKLQKTYEIGLVVISLQFYINLIKSALNGTFVDSMMPSYVLHNDNEITANNFLDYNKIKNFWDIKDLEHICKLYDECFEINNNIAVGTNKEFYILGKLQNVDTILSIYEKKFQNLIRNSTRG